MLRSFSLDRVKVAVFSKLLDTLRVFIPEANLLFNDKGLSLSNFDATHTVVAMGAFNSDFLGKVEKGGASEEIVAINLDELHKILKSSTKLVQVDFKVYNDKIETLLLGSSQRQKSRFNIDTYNTNTDFSGLNESIDENLEEYETKLSLNCADFREILNALKIFKCDQVTVQYNKSLNKLTFLTGEQNQHIIEYMLPVDTKFLEEEILEASDTISQPQDDLEPREDGLLILQLGMERLLNLSKATNLSSHLQMALKSEYHPLYFSFHIDDDPSNKLVVGLSPRNT